MQEKACDFGHEEGLMALYKLILQIQKIRFSPAYQACTHRADLEHIWLTMIRHSVNYVSDPPHHNVNKALETQIDFY